jgi:hypothetical protein
MYCRQCGTRVDDAPFCTKCGAACGPEAPARPSTGSTVGRRRVVIGSIAGVLVLAAVAVAVVMLRRPVPPATATAQGASPAPPGPDSVTAASAGEPDGFKWSGLSTQQIRDARNAMDTAIAREEAAHASAGSAATKDPIAVGVAPNGTKDGVRL